jgi:hypothetical protein
MPAISGQMCATLEFGALLFNGTTNSSLCGVTVSITTEPALVVDADGLLGPPPVNRRRAGAAYNVTFTFSEPIRPAVLLMEGVDAQVLAGQVLAANLPGGALNITSNTTQLVAAPPTAAPTTTAATTTSATTAETANATTDGTESTTTTAATEAPVAEMLPVSITTLTLQIDDSNVRFKSISVQKPFAATTATVLTSGSTTMAAAIAPETEWYLMEAGPLLLWHWLAAGGGLLVLIVIIIIIVCVVKRKKGRSSDDEYEMYSHRDMVVPAAAAVTLAPVPVRSPYDGATIKSEDNYSSVGVASLAPPSLAPPETLSETGSQRETYQALPTYSSN